MLCPYCDSPIVQTPELTSCPHCGAALPPYRDSEERRREIVNALTFPSPPVRTCKNGDDCLTFENDCITIRSKPFFKEHTRVICYRDLFAVSYHEHELLCVLSIREWKDRHLPLAKTVSDTQGDKTSFVFNLNLYKEELRNIYAFLERCIQMIHEANPEWKHDRLLLLMGLYQGSFSSMELQKDAVSFSQKGLMAQPTHRLIPYSSIVDVRIQKASRHKSGQLLVLERRDLGSSVPRCNCIDFKELYNSRMQEIFDCLKQHAEENKQSPDYREAERKKAELDASEKLYCPACFSLDIRSVQVPKPYIHRPLTIRDPKARIFSNTVYLARLAIQSAQPNTIKHTCTNCGHQWSQKE